MPALPAGIVAQHSALAALISDVRAAHARGATWEDLAKRLDALVATVKEHFDSEEQEMAQARYPLLVEHAKNHETFLRRLRILREECDRRESELMAVFMDLLENWFKNHERSADELVIEYLAGNHSGSN
jgi:hemerythrin-like metal-binding protein